MKKTIRLALAQTNPVLGDLKGNFAVIAKNIKTAGSFGADIVLFPELALCGYPPEDLLHRPSFLDDNNLWMDRLTDEVGQITAIVGFAEKTETGIWNSAAVITDGKRAGTCRKMELPNYGVFDEKRYFSASAKGTLITLNGVIIMLTICEDVWVEKNAVWRVAREHHPDLILNLSASPFYAGKYETRLNTLKRFIRMAKAPLGYCNMTGGQDELVFDGGSMVLDRDGEILIKGQSFTEELITIDLELNVSEKTAEASNLAEVIQIRPFRTVKPQLPPKRISPDPAETETLYRALVLGTRDYIRKNGFQKAVLGISGGIDSALTMCIAVNAIGALNVIGVTMPSRYTSNETRADALKICDTLGVECLTIPIGEIFKTYETQLSEAFTAGRQGLEFENLQARIRGNLLMALSNRFNYLVLTTGNKSESAVGYATLYGDMAGGFSVIKDVLKVTVYELSDYINTQAGFERIPKSIIERPPTAELRENQKDEDSLPPYNVLDPILKAYIEDEKNADEIAQTGVDIDLVRDIIQMVDRAEYKRRQAPPGIKITPRAFGRDRRLPITNRYRYSSQKE